MPTSSGGCLVGSQGDRLSESLHISDRASRPESAYLVHNHPPQPTSLLCVSFGLMVAVRGIPSGMPGFQVARSANLRTAATYHRVAAISGGSITYLELHHVQRNPESPAKRRRFPLRIPRLQKTPRCRRARIGSLPQPSSPQIPCHPQTQHDVFDCSGYQGRRPAGPHLRVIGPGQRDGERLRGLSGRPAPAQGNGDSADRDAGRTGGEPDAR
ncbi:hypothetical protein FJD35_18780 [Pseudomonas mandelii]|nr:hypothetical protein FJD35_18780 [Pseudomonas mandelii]